MALFMCKPCSLIKGRAREIPIRFFESHSRYDERHRLSRYRRALKLIKQEQAVPTSKTRKKFLAIKAFVFGFFA